MVCEIKAARHFYHIFFLLFLAVLLQMVISIPYSNQARTNGKCKIFHDKPGVCHSVIQYQMKTNIKKQ